MLLTSSIMNSWLLLGFFAGHCYNFRNQVLQNMPPNVGGCNNRPCLIGERLARCRVEDSSMTWECCLAWLGDGATDGANSSCRSRTPKSLSWPAGAIYRLFFPKSQTYFCIWFITFMWKYAKIKHHVEKLLNRTLYITQRGTFKAIKPFCKVCFAFVH